MNESPLRDQLKLWIPVHNQTGSGKQSYLGLRSDLKQNLQRHVQKLNVTGDAHNVKI